MKALLFKLRYSGLLDEWSALTIAAVLGAVLMTFARAIRLEGVAAFVFGVTTILLFPLAIAVLRLRLRRFRESIIAIKILIANAEAKQTRFEGLPPQAVQPTPCEPPVEGDAYQERDPNWWKNEQ